MALPHRRGYGSTDEPSPATDGFIETDLSAGGPWLRDFLCAAYDIVPKSSPYKEILWHEGGRISSQLEDICCAKGYPNVSALFRGRYPRYEPDAERTVTLVVTVSEGRETVTPSCTRIDLARILWRDLCERGFEGITVEVHDVRAVRRPEIYPCLPTNDIFPIWTDVAMEIFDEIDRAGVFTVGCFRIGAYRWERLECPPTVLIGVGRHSKRDWKDVRETVVSILDRRGLDSVVVTIRKDNKIARGVLGMDWEPGATIADCRPDPRPGTSLGPCSKHGIHSEGRLAGWVEVKNLQSENWVPFAMTCSHCCFPEETTLCAADIEVIHSWKHRGVHPGDAHRHRLLQVDSPNDNGMEKALTTLAGSIDEAKTDLEDLEAEIQENKAHRLKVTLDDLTEAENKQAIFANFRNSKSHHLGTVFAASGERRAPSTADSKHLSIRDWDLVQPAAPRCAGRNMVKHIAFPDKDQQLIHSSLFPGLPKMDEKLYTPGAKGVYGNLKTCHIFTKVENGHAIDIPTFEHVVVRCKTRVQWEERLDEPGSFIYSITGCTKGMIFGGSGSGDLGYFTATEDILDDIQHITGAEEVRLLYVDE